MSSFAGKPAYIIAEAGVNHNGSMEMARRLIDVAVEAGADAVKFQTFKIASVVSAHTPMAEYQAENTGGKGTMAEMLVGLDLSFQDFAELAAYAGQKGIDFLSTGFDVESIEFLATLGMKYFKIPSGEVTNPELVRLMGRQGRPIIMSSGMATLGDIEQAIGWLNEEGAEDIVLLHCVSDYPADPKDANLAAMDTMAKAFCLPVGWSDHTLGDTVTIAAVARGACVIEKHFTLDTSLPGPDHKASLDPAGLKRMVENIRITESAIGTGRKKPTAREVKVAEVARRSIVARRDMPAGAVLSREDVVFLRPGSGIAPIHLDFLLGRTLRTPIKEGHLLSTADFS